MKINIYSADSKFAASQWETLLQSNAISHWLGANLESALYAYLPDADHYLCQNLAGKWTIALCIKTFYFCV